MDAQRIISTHVSLSLAAASASSSATPAALPTLASDPPPEELVEGIRQGKIGLLDVVKGLGEYLTSTEDPVRIRGVNLLAGVLMRIPSEKITRQGTQVLSTFFTDKLDDPDAFPTALMALATLSKLPTFGGGEAAQVWAGIYGAVGRDNKMRAYVQATRHLVYVLVDSLVDRHRQALKALGPDFVAQYVKIVQGEKDPRNLMLVFGLDLVILRDMDPWTHLEDLFDVVFCYFPITFRPPPDDPYGITSDDLKLALRRCMAASPRFAPLALPLFLEKLPPSLGASKRDALQTLAACLPVYGARGVEGYASDLWDALKPEIYYSSDTEIERDAHEAFRALMATLYPIGSEQKQIDFAVEIVKDCQESLKEPEKAKATPAGKILASMFEASPLVGRFALAQALPQLFKQYHQSSEATQRGAIVAIIADLLAAVQQTYAVAAPGGRRMDDERPLDLYRDELLNILGSGIDNASSTVKRPALHGIIQLLHLRGFLALEEMTYLVQRIDGLLQSPEDALRDEAIEGLVAVSELSVRPIEQAALPALFARLPDSAPPIDDDETRFWYRETLRALSKLSVQPGLFEPLMIRLVVKLESLGEAATPAGDALSPECAIAYAYDLLNCLVVTLQSKTEKRHADVAKFFEPLVPRVFALALAGASARSSVFSDPRILSISASLNEVMTLSLPSARQAQFADALFASYQSGDFKSLSNSPELRVLSADAPDASQNLVILLAGAVIALQPASFPAIDLDAFASNVLDWSLSAATHAFTHTCYLLSSMVNKRAESLTTFIHSLETSFWQIHIQAATQPDARSTRALKVWMWLARALVTRNHPAGHAMVDSVLGLFASHTLGAIAASSFAIFADAHGTRILTKTNLATVKPLYKQKLFNSLLPVLVNGCKQGESTSQPVYLSAFGSMIAVIPRSMIVNDLPALLPLIMRGTSIPLPDVRFNMLETLYAIIEAEDDSSRAVIRSHAKSLIDAMLAAALDRDARASSPKARAQALKCLSILPDALSTDAIKPNKARVVTELGAALADPKRSVRKEAVDARAVWYRQQGAAA